jgi:hypothetical protein
LSTDVAPSVLSDDMTMQQTVTEVTRSLHVDNEWGINPKDIPWYLNIPPEGVMCYVSSVNAIPKDRRTFRIYSYRPDQHLPFCGGGSIARDHWKYAVPVSDSKFGSVPQYEKIVPVYLK